MVLAIVVFYNFCFNFFPVDSMDSFGTKRRILGIFSGYFQGRKGLLSIPRVIFPPFYFVGLQ